VVLLTLSGTMTLLLALSALDARWRWRNELYIRLDRTLPGATLLCIYFTRVFICQAQVECYFCSQVM
jgi:hypothetical protein